MTTSEEVGGIPQLSSSSVGPEWRRTWIFQANPKKYRILDSLVAEKEELWNLNQHAHAVQEGDRVLIWISGDNAGIYAVGTVVSMPMFTQDTPSGMRYWLTPAEGTKVKPRVLVRYDRLLLDLPLTKAFLMTDPILSELRILKCAMGTNFAVTDEQCCALDDWLEDDTVS